jgi:hypothetical protein
MTDSTSTVDDEDRANELYWGSDRSVNQIAEELDLSKGALYGVIRPLAAGMGCPRCGAEVVHTNRTARERGMVGCPSCGWDGVESETVAGYAPVPMPADEEPSLAPRPGASPYRSSSEAPARALLGGALLGTAVGLALVLWARRR